MAIKWRDQDVDLLKKTVKNFNAKISRIVKKNPEAAAYLPKKVSYAELRKTITTRRDFNSQVKMLKRFSQKGAEAPITNKKGLTITKWEKKEVARQTGIVNRKRKALQKQFNITFGSGLVGAIQQYQLGEKKMRFENKTKQHWEDYKRKIFDETGRDYRAKKAAQYLKNYKTAVDRELGQSGILVKLLADKADGEWLYDAYALDPDLQIDFVYGAELEYDRIRKIMKAFERYGYVLDKEERERYKKELELVFGNTDIPGAPKGAWEEVYIEPGEDEDYWDW